MSDFRPAVHSESRTRWGVGAIAAAILLLIAAALPASASAYVYWVNEETESIGRTGLDGSAANPSVVSGLGTPTGVAVDGSHIYWSDSTTDSVGRANLDGSDPIPAFIAGARDPSALARRSPAPASWISPAGA